MSIPESEDYLKTRGGDTIAAIATPAGEGGLGVIRISGPKSPLITLSIFRTPKGSPLKSLVPRKLHLGKIWDEQGALDEVCVVFFNAPHSYTREHVVEISSHGSPAVLRKILKLAILSGARIAEPGEFTKRAFLNGRIDLSQAEGVIDLIKSRSEGAALAAYRLMEGGLSARIDSIRQKLVGVLSNLEASIDFPDEDFQTASDEEIYKILDEALARMERLVKSYDGGRFLRHGINLLNAIVEEERAIVTNHPGTTRDLIRADAEISGLKVELVDTAGLNPAPDEVEAEGIRRSMKAAETADVVLGLFDGSRPWEAADDAVLELLKKSRRFVVAINKADIPQLLEWPDAETRPVLISAKTGAGFKELTGAISAWGRLEGEEPVVTRMRHRDIFTRIAEDLRRAKDELKAGRELAAAAVWDALEEVKRFTGESYTEEVLNALFSEFCVGK
ncbi:MAG: tRNA uridine-5-carboxymethylaminomethyl(34) synthesis GTPase MnmE [Nitrospinae bacterium]|nr:tRNA uridine-5-carboxymethylaminomethyl(34) synthesis GTPase MnmE [Nitrospinota bacterium]